MSSGVPGGHAPVRVTGAGADWEALTLPDAQPAIRRAVLHREGRGGASVQAVEFPAGWRREAAGHFLVDEEFLVLRGELQLSGIGVGTGDHAVVPAGAVRVESSVGPDGCLAVAWFSGVPGWRRGATSAASGPITCRRVDGVLLTEGGRCRRYPSAGVPGPADVVTTDGRWTWVPDGDVLPAPEGDAVVRLWGGQAPPR